jgi:folylpolyglutamate synthase
MLGSTISEIAWHKAGIAKSNSMLLTVQQPPEAIEVIKKRCKGRNVGKIKKLIFKIII